MALARIDPAFTALRRARRRNAVADIDWIDALYRVYVTAIAGGIAVVLLAGAAGDERVTGRALSRVIDDGPLVLAALALVLGVIGVRSGRRGGPLALEPADVSHVLLAPVGRGPILRSLALHQLRFALFVGVVVGAVAGFLASRRLPGEAAGWIAAGAGQGAVTVAFVLGLGYAAAARGLWRRRRSWSCWPGPRCSVPSPCGRSTTRRPTSWPACSAVSAPSRSSCSV